MLRRLRNLIRGFLSLFISGMEKRNPEALLELEKESLCKQIAQFNQGLSAHAGLCEKLIAQVKREEREEQELKAKAAANLRAGNQRQSANEGSKSIHCRSQDGKGCQRTGVSPASSRDVPPAATRESPKEWLSS